MSTPERNRRVPLGYTSVPVPIRAVDAVSQGRLTCERFTLVAFLYRSADYRRLARRLPTPVLTRQQIAAGVGRSRHHSR